MVRLRKRLMTRERELWTRYVEQRRHKAEPAAKPRRVRKQPQPSAAERERALDDLVSDARSHDRGVCGAVHRLK
jgi:hypothetical protein